MNHSVTRLDTERRDRRNEQAIKGKLDALPAEMAEHMLAWVQVMRGEGRRRHPAVDYPRILRNLRVALPVLHTWALAGLNLREVTRDHVQTELRNLHGHQARGVHHALLSIFRALKQQRIIFHNPMAGLSLSTPVRLPTPLPSDRLQGALHQIQGARGRFAVALVAVHALKASEVRRLPLTAVDLVRGTLTARRGDHTHTVYLDPITMGLAADWLHERRRTWPMAPNPHLFITSQTAHHPSHIPVSYLGLRAAFDQIGMTPRQLWSDRVLDEARVSADPVHLIRLFGIHPSTAMKYVAAAHPDKAFPKIR
ncbi:hypothetical protein AB0D97_34370 [Streptomyces roseus]|uniref:hypothetical protein n=1 Tax=Streptomyces roseus TaxID=66430 RepID=UPI00340DAD7A